jgi:hypothetical protein
MPADFSSMLDPVVAVFTSAAAVHAYTVMAGVGVAIGSVVTLGPRLWRFVWRFLPDEGIYDDGDYWESAEMAESAAEAEEYTRRWGLE